MTTEETTIELTRIALDKLAPHPDNVRRKVEDLTDLAKSIEGVGILEPLLVLPANDQGLHLIVAGHRRHAAASKTTVADAPCVVRDLTPVEVIEAMLVENMQRADLDPVEEAKAYARLVELEATVAGIASKVGRSAKHVKARLELLQLPDAVLDLYVAGKVTLAGLADLLKHAADDDALGAWVKEARKRNPDWQAAQDPARWVAGYVTRREYEAKRQQIRATIEKDQLRVHTERHYFEGRHRIPTLTTATALENLKLGRKATAHKKEPCHAVLLSGMDSSPWSKPEMTAVCTDPIRHTSHAKAGDVSEIQMAADTYEGVPVKASRTGSGAKQGPTPKVKKAMTAARFAHVVKTAPKTKLDDAMLGVILRTFNDTAGDARDFAGRMLDPTVKKGFGYPVWDAFRKDPKNVRAALVILSMAQSHTRDWSDARLELPAFLRATGYEPVEGEAPWLDKALAEFDKAHPVEGQS